MKKRSVAAVVLLPFITLGIYTLYWFVSTKGELNDKGAKIPTAWLLIIPFVNLWWLWKYFDAAEKITNEKVSGVLMFVLAILVTSIISSAVCQDAYNKMTESSSEPSMNPSEPQANENQPVLTTPTPEQPATDTTPSDTASTEAQSSPTLTDSENSEKQV
jgi:hypothetical protein